MKMAAIETIKFKKLKMKLGLPEWQVVGLLESLWLFTSRNAPAGDIGRHSNSDIAAAIDYREDPDQLIETLVGTRWLDADETHRLLVHDWQEHCPAWLANNMKSHSKEFAKPTAKQPAKQDRGDAAKQPAKDVASSLTSSSHAFPSEDYTHTAEAKSEPTASGPREHYLTGKSPEFHAFYAAYPRPAKIESAWENWQAVVWKIGNERNMTDAAVCEYLIGKAREFAASPSGSKPSGPDYRPLPAVWLKSGAYDDPASELAKPNETGEAKRSNGSAPKKPRVLPLAPKAQPKSVEIGDEMLRLMK